MQVLHDGINETLEPSKIPTAANGPPQRRRSRHATGAVHETPSTPGRPWVWEASPVSPPRALPTKYDTPRGQVIIVHQEDQARVLPYIEKTPQQKCLKNYSWDILVEKTGTFSVAHKSKHVIYILFYSCAVYIYVSDVSFTIRYYTYN